MTSLSTAILDADVTDSDDILDEIMGESQLDALMIESATLEHENMSLEGLLAESLEAQAELALAKEIRKKQARGNLSKEEQDANNALLRQWEMKREWTAVANVLVFDRQLCSHCGTYHNVLAGFYEKHDHRNILTASRMVKVKAFEKALTKEVKYNDETVSICHTCADVQGDWELEDDSNEFDTGANSFETAAVEVQDESQVPV